MKCRTSVNDYPADMVCQDCGHADMTTTRRKNALIEGLNRLCGIREEWICLKCGHIWKKRNQV